VLHQIFLAIIACYQLILAGRDFVVTGILAKGLPPDWRFHTYCIITTLEVTVLAAFAVLTEPNVSVAVLKAWTVYLCWIGGALDWIYFLLRLFVTNVPMPEWTFIWHWMPQIFPYITHGKITFDHPTTKHWIAYTCLMWVPNLICWTILLT